MMAQWPISASQREERVKFALEFREKEIPFWLSKVYYFDNLLHGGSSVMRNAAICSVIG